MKHQLNVTFLFVVLTWFFIGFEVTYAEERLTTNYDIRFDEAVETQFNAQAKSTTSLYADEAVYINSDLAQIFQSKYKFGGYYSIYENASRDSERLEVSLRSSFTRIIQVVTGEEINGSDLWYKILLKKGQSGFVHSGDLPFSTIKLKGDADVLDDSNDKAHVFGRILAHSEHYILDFNNDFFAIAYQTWRYAKKSDLAHYMNPELESKFQHLRLDKLAHVSADQVDDVLVGKGALEGEGAAFVQGAKDASINEAYLIAHAFLETGHGTSPLATGFEVGRNGQDGLELVTDANRADLVDIKTVYNMFGIEAVDSCPVECGAFKAYEAGWTSPAIAIAEGAGWIGRGYIYNEFEQNTLYKMRWNPQMKDGAVWKQYATDVGWAVKQTGLIEDIYHHWDHADMVLDYPVFEE